MPDELSVDPVEGEESAARPRRWVQAAGRWAARGVAVLAIAALTPVVAGAAILSPYLADDFALDHTVRAVALDWRDFGRAEAQARLEYELDHRQIGLQVGDADCTLAEDGGQRQVACAWSTEFDVPGLESPVAVPFTSRAAITPEGELR